MLAQAASRRKAFAPIHLTKGGKKWLAATLRSLSLEEKIGQMLMGRCFLDYASFDSPDYKQLRDDLRKYHMGSLVVAAHVNRQGLVRPSPLEAAKVANQLQADSKLPLLLAADLERGLASRLTNVPDFPWPMALGAAGDTALGFARRENRPDAYGTRTPYAKHERALQAVGAILMDGTICRGRV